MGIRLYVPQYGETIDNHDADIIFDIAARKGHEQRFVELDWKETVTDWSQAVKQAYAECDPNETEIISMSLGSVATLAAIATVKVQPRRLCLLSLSARWKEDIPNMPAEHLAVFSEAQIAAFAQLSFNEIAPRVICPTLLVVGSLEREKLPAVWNRVEKAAELIPNSMRVIAENAGHALYHDGYQQALRTHL
jgi:predicted alpha/beta hydrolase family esterase